jgi:hypothetical protein
VPAYDDDYPQPSYRYYELSGLSTDYTVALGGWFAIATAHYGAVLGPAVAYLLLLGVLFAVMAFIPCLGALLIVLLSPPLAAGLTTVSLAQLKGEPWTFGDFFAGFQYYGALLGFTLLTALMAVPFAFLSWGMFAAAFFSNDEGMLFAAFGAGAALVCAAVYVQVRVQTFGWQLIIDRRFDAIEAMKGSWRLTRGHFWSLFGVQLLLGLINQAGGLACGVGLLFTLPLTALVSSAGYLLVAGTRPPREGPRPAEDHPGVT